MRPARSCPTNVVASALSRAGSAEVRAAAFLPGLVSGELVAAWAAAEGRFPWSNATMACRAERSSGGWVVNGVKAPVEAGAEADLLLVTAATDAGLTQFLVDADAPGVTVLPMDSIDLVRRVAQVSFDDVAVDDTRMVGSLGGAAEALEHQLQIAVVLQCAETVGATAAVFDFTLEYVVDRYSFGRPLSSYQALKHRFADMKMWLEASHAHRDARRPAQCSTTTADAAELVSAAKAYVGEQRHRDHPGLHPAARRASASPGSTTCTSTCGGSPSNRGLYGTPGRPPRAHRGRARHGDGGVEPARRADARRRNRSRTSARVPAPGWPTNMPPSRRPTGTATTER